MYHYLTFFFLISSPFTMKPFIGIVGMANAGVRFGVETLLLFLVIGLLIFERVGTGREGLGGAGADVFNG